VNERGIKILEQYDLKVYSTRRGRSSFICETNQGLKLLTEFRGSAKKLHFQNRLLQHLRLFGYQNVDMVMENIEGSLVSKDRDETVYVVKDWYEGRECDTKSEKDILSAVRNLAHLHGILELPAEKEEESYVGLSLPNEFERRNRELKKVRSYIRGRQQKGSFELCFLDSFSLFFEQALESAECLSQSEYPLLYQKSLEKGLLCHGEYNQHNILIFREEIATTNFNRCKYDVQTGDLYQFLRKILEKQNWNPNIGMAVIEEYDKTKGLSRQEMNDLKIRLTYPEKFWKLANHYYNRNKAWIPGKNVEKLKIMIDQQEKRMGFLKLLDS